MIKCGSIAKGGIRYIFAALVIFILVFTQIPLNFAKAQSVSSGDWPTNRYDPAGTAFAADETRLLPPLEQTNSIRLSSALTLNEAPILAGGYLLVVEENGLCAYSVENQTQSWCFNELNEIEISGAVGAEIHATGVDPVTGLIDYIILDLSEGTLIGKIGLKQTGDDVVSCISISEVRAYCTIGSTLFSLSVDSSMIDWSVALDAPGYMPVALGDMVYAATETSVYAVNTSDGQQLWNVTLPAGSILESPTVFDNKLVVGGQDGSFYALDTTTGVILWSYLVLEGEPCLAAYGNGNLILTSTAGVIEGIDPANGQARWTYDPGFGDTLQCPAPVLANGFVYAGFADGSLRAVDLANGKEAWTFVSLDGFSATGLAISNGNLILPVAPDQVAFFSSAVPEQPTATPEAPLPTPSLTDTPEVPLPTPSPTETNIDPQLILVAPVLVSPPDGAKTNDSTPFFTWNPVMDADHYQLQISQVTDFSTTVHDELLSAGVSTYTSDALNDGRYYWRVRGVNSLGEFGTWSAYWKFKIDTVAPEIPKLSAPANGASINTVTPKFTVFAVSGAKYYHFQVAADESFTNLLAENDSILPISSLASYRLTESEALPLATVYWRAQARDAAGNNSGWSKVRWLVVNILKTPSNNSYTTDRKPTFTWGAVAGALSYQLQVSTSLTFQDPLVIDITRASTSTSFTPPNNLPYGKFYWRMMVETTSGLSDPTPPYFFTITKAIPTAPVLASPHIGVVTNDNTPTLRWIETFRIGAPQLRINYRTIQVYLPPDYYTEPLKSYPVIYLQDGEIMFDATAGEEYQVDETLEKLISNGTLQGVIAVGIYSSNNRWDEYSPWINNYMLEVWHANGATQIEGGEGDRYMEFVVNTLKPEIDRRYRTLPDRDNTAIGGGSMGGLISLYGGLKYSNVFSKVISFSPAVWFAESNDLWLSSNRLINYIRQNPVPSSRDMKIFLYVGTREWYGRTVNTYTSTKRQLTYPEVWQQGANAVYSALLYSGLSSKEITFVTTGGGIHAPNSWSIWVDNALKWFFVPQDLPPAGRADFTNPIGEDTRDYIVQVSKSNTFAKIVQSATVRGLHFVPDALNDGGYYWRVKPVNDLDIQGGWSRSHYFIVDTTPPGVPKLIAPSDGAKVKTTTPVLTVGVVNGAYDYHFQVAGDDTFTTLLLDKTNSKVATFQVPVNSALPFGVLYWRVRTVDRAGNSSAWSEVHSMVINILLSPSDGSYTTSTSPKFSWAPAAGASNYRVQVCSLPDFNNNAIDVTLGAAANSLIPGANLEYGKYYWRLQVKTSAGWSNWTPAFSFSVTTKPAAPILVTPASGSVVSISTPSLNWSEVIDPAIAITGYVVQVGYSSTFSPLAQSATVTGLTYVTSSLGDGTYYWRVRAVNELGMNGKWSPVWAFTVNAVP